MTVYNSTHTGAVIDQAVTDVVAILAAGVADTITGQTIEATGDTSAGDKAAMGYTAVEGHITTGQGSTNDWTLKNDADTQVLGVLTGTTDIQTDNESTTNTKLGVTAGDALTTGALDNTLYGFDAGGAVTSGDNNTCIGADAGAAIVTSGDNTFVGAQAGLANTAAATVGVGYNSLAANVAGVRNTAIGWAAGLTQSNANDDDNTWVGYAAGTLANGSASGGNTGIGSKALDACTTGHACTGVGLNALGANETGQQATAVGAEALAANTANGNTAVGYAALDANTSAAGNTAVGQNAVGSTITGANNTGIGQNALLQTTGANNTSLGATAGDVITTGSGNTCIGQGTDPSANSGVDQIVLGRGVTGTADNAITLGDSTRAISCNFDADQTWDAPSDLRMKNVQGTSSLGLSFINRLSTIEFTLKPTAEWPKKWGKTGDEKVSNKTILGLGAQDVKAAMDAEGETVFHGWSENENNGQQSIGESAFVYPLINAVNELTTRLERLEG
tara:strand:+ start:618 stop:2132 length:1515 start_codon:yes stop_codon:yes gene_type:complete